MYCFPLSMGLLLMEERADEILQNKKGGIKNKQINRFILEECSHGGGSKQ